MKYNEKTKMIEMSEEELEFLKDSYVEDFDIEAEMASGNCETFEIDIDVIKKRKEG